MGDSLNSPNGLASLRIQDDGGLVLYHKGNPVWQASDIRINTEGPSPPRLPLPAGMIQGQLQPDGDQRFIDDRGPLLPIGCTYGWGLGQCRNTHANCVNQLDEIAGSGYQYVRTWFSLGYYPYWRGHEVAPVSFVAQDGIDVPGWGNYYDAVRRYCDMLSERGLQLFWSCGDLQMFSSQGIGRMREWSYNCGRTIASTGCRIAFADVNEAWQNWITDSEPDPEDIDQNVINPLSDGYGKPFIKLRSANFHGEEKQGVDRWARDLSQVHGHRGNYENDFVTAVRHAWNRGYEGDYKIRLQIESEPGGPNKDGGSPVMGPLYNEEGLCLLAAANFIAGSAYVFHSHRGVQSWIGKINEEPGFYSVPRVRNILPDDLHLQYRQYSHGNSPDSPFTDDEGFPDGSERRIDTVQTNEGHFVSLVYDRSGRTVLRMRENVQFICYTPDSGEGHSFKFMSGETLPIHYDKGRILVGKRS